MANTIYLGTDSSDDSVCMNNGLTSVFIDVLSLSGSLTAKTIDEKRLIVWLSEKDQSKVGMGIVGFDICDMPWNAKTFENDKMFILETIERAKNKAGWNHLQYAPEEDAIFTILNKFGKLISIMSADKIKAAALEKWLADAKEDDPVLCGFPQCSTHHALLTVWGCHICNN